MDQKFLNKMEEEKGKVIKQVHLDSTALLKIINHSNDKLPTMVTGVLLGINTDYSLKITNSFPLPSKLQHENEMEGDMNAVSEYDDEQKYQYDMMSCLRDVNSDLYTVGWYQSSLQFSFLNLTTIETQYSYQLEFGPRCVCIVYDPSLSHRGKVHLKAIRLSDKFLDFIRDLYSQKTTKPEDMIIHGGLPSTLDAVNFTQDFLAKHNMTSQMVFEELPVKISNLALVESFLLDLEEEADDLDIAEFDSLDLWTSPFIESSLEGLLDSTNELMSEHTKFKRYHSAKLAQQQKLIQSKKKGEDIELSFKSIQQPDRLQSLIVSNQVHSFCDNINTYASASLEKLYLSETMLKQK